MVSLWPMRYFFDWGIGLQRRRVVFTQYIGSILASASGPDLTMAVVPDGGQSCVSCGLCMVEGAAGDGGDIFPDPLSELGVCQRLKEYFSSRKCWPVGQLCPTTGMFGLI